MTAVSLAALEVLLYLDAAKAKITAHHVRPGPHWPRLPELHSRRRDRIPASLR